MCVQAEGRGAVQLLCLSAVEQVALDPPSVFGKCEKVRASLEDWSLGAVLFFSRIPSTVTH